MDNDTIDTNDTRKLFVHFDGISEEDAYRVLRKLGFLKPTCFHWNVAIHGQRKVLMVNVRRIQAKHYKKVIEKDSKVTKVEIVG